VSRVTRATVDLTALQSNLATARAAAPGSQLLAVLKADAYGHGLLPAAGALAEADGFAVSCLGEAQPLRRAGYRHRIVLLEGFFDADEIEAFVADALDPVIHAHWQLDLLAAHPPSRPLDVWIKVDSGMHRLGFQPHELDPVRERLASLAGVSGVRFLTHLACADDRDDDTTNDQLRTFDNAVPGTSGERSIANSAATLGWPTAHADWVRPGIMLYGCSPFADTGSAPDLRPALTLEARLIAVQEHSAGARIGYGGTFVCPERMPVGIVSIGYGDGYPRRAPNGTPVLVNGVRCGLAGRVSMDMINVDLRNAPQARPGDRVVLWGADQLRAEEVAAHCQTISYELLCQITDRVSFHYSRGLDATG
jgi:alanine racemase